MAVQILQSSFIDDKYYKTMEGLEELENKSKLHNIINMSINFMENFCDRKLKSRDYSYELEELEEGEIDLTDYDESYSIFDGNKGNIFYFPTYPVNSLSKFVISDVEIEESASINDNGYVLYKNNGKLIYHNGFDFGYNKNIKCKWNGGYLITHPEYFELQYIQYIMVNKYMNDELIDVGILSESLGNYRYSKGSIQDLSKTSGLPVFIFDRLKKYKKVVIG